MKTKTSNTERRFWDSGYGMVLLGLLIILCVVVCSDLANAQEIPDHPQPQNVDQFPAFVTTPEIHPNHGRSYASLVAVSYAAAIFDIETTANGLSNCGGYETNPLMGKHPGRARLYTFALGVNTGLVLYGEYVRRKFPKMNHWWAKSLLLPSTVIHTYAGVHNIRMCQ